ELSRTGRAARVRHARRGQRDAEGRPGRRRPRDVPPGPAAEGARPAGRVRTLMPVDGSVVALDVGSRRIGVAVSDPLGTFAFPHDTIERTNVRDDVAAIVALARERDARTIVVGDPLTMAGKRG